MGFLQTLSYGIGGGGPAMVKKGLSRQAFFF
jgi:hypothetical protein